MLLTPLPTEIWGQIFKKCSWQDAKKAELTCKQIYFVVQDLLKKDRSNWANVCSEINTWCIPKLIFEIETKPLYYKQSVFITFARIIGIKRFNNLPILNSEGVLGSTGYVDKITPNQMTAPIMKGITGKSNDIQFLAIRYQIEPEVKDPELQTLWGRLHVMVMFTKCYRGDPFEMMPAIENCFPNISTSEHGSIARHQLLPKLLCEGSLIIRDEKEARDHTWYHKPHQIKIV